VTERRCLPEGLTRGSNVDFGVYGMTSMPRASRERCACRKTDSRATTGIREQRHSGHPEKLKRGPQVIEAASAKGGSWRSR